MPIFVNEVLNFGVSGLEVLPVRALFELLLTRTSFRFPILLKSAFVADEKMDGVFVEFEVEGAGVLRFSFSIADVGETFA